MDTAPTELSTPTQQSVPTLPNNASTSETLLEHLSYPTQSEPLAPVIPTSSPAQTRTILKNRLYVGNLHTSVDEYTLLQVFSKYGNISKLDYLFHKSGPMRGKPRGYAFVEYADKTDAEKALTHAHDKLVRGRKLVVTYANQAPIDSFSGALGAGSKNRRAISEVGKPTTLSLLKSAGTARSDARTETKIAQMEAKLRQLEGATAAGVGPSLHGHPSLPPKPVTTAVAATEAHRHASISSTGVARARTRAHLPSLPIVPPTQPSLSRTPPVTTPPGSTPRAHPAKKSALSGVRIVRPKSSGPTD